MEYEYEQICVNCGLPIDEKAYKKQYAICSDCRKEMMLEAKKEKENGRIYNKRSTSRS